MVHWLNDEKAESQAVKFCCYIAILKIITHCEHKVPIANISVLICIIINGLSYLAVEQLTNYFQINPFREGSRVDVEFSLGFYMITTAGVVSIVGVACNLLRRTASHSRREHRDQIPFRPPPPADLHQSFCSQLAPPPYTP